MREIKFRAWDKTNRGMYFYRPLGAGVDHSMLDAELLNYLPSETGEFGDEDCEWILMQYTGLSDKNGKEIYEGDIVYVEWMDDETMDKGTVGWCDAGFRFIMEGEGFMHDPAHWHKEHADLWEDPDTLNIEVIGNIYEDKELLK